MTAFLRRYPIATAPIVEAQSIACLSPPRHHPNDSAKLKRFFLCKNLNLIWPTMPDFAFYPAASMIGSSSPVF
jgi:hypothetical protein